MVDLLDMNLEAISGKLVFLLMRAQFSNQLLRLSLALPSSSLRFLLAPKYILHRNREKPFGILKWLACWATSLTKSQLKRCIFYDVGI